MSSIFDEHPRDNCRKLICFGEEESRIPDTNLLCFSEDCPDLCVDCAPKMDGSAYKRRKLHGNTAALLAEENTSYITTAKLIADNYNISCDDDHFTEIKGKGYLLISGQHCLSSSVELFPNFIPKCICIIGENFEKEHAASLNGSCSLSKGNVECSSTSENMKTPKRAEESADADDVEKLPEKFTSPLELCIYVLKSHGLLGERHPSACPSELPCPNNPCPQPCKICGDLESPLEMLICDNCEEAFHLSCCNPKVKKTPVDNWYCQACIWKKPKLCLRRSSNIKDGKQSYRDLLPIMLNKTRIFFSHARVGEAFQVEVPDWSGPSSIDHDYFGEEMTLTKLRAPYGWNFRKSTSIGNWLQCREVMQGDKKSICGKWRRAPLSEGQTDNWDCSCAVLWDPIHSDCAVPQELSTREVMNQLEFIKMINVHLAARLVEKANDPHHPSNGEGQD